MIEVENLSKVYGSTVAVRDVTFAVESGEILGFLGPNGAGKTTTMRILSGYLPATSGTARIADYDVHTDSIAVRQRIGYLPETPPLYPNMTVESFLYFVSRIKGIPAGDRAQQVDSAIQRCNLSEKRTVLIRKLSKGFRQRVGIAQAIVHDPPAIILDEPTVGLDPRQIIDVRNLIKSLAGDHTIILSTHILPEVSMTCSRVAIINQGQVVATDTPENLTARLAGSAGYDIEIEGDPDRATQLLGELAGVRSVKVLTSDASLPEQRHQLQILPEPSVEVGRDIAKALVESEIGLCEMRRTRISLEDVFLNLTTEENPLPETAPEAEGAEVELEDEPESQPENKPEPETGEVLAEGAIADDDQDATDDN